MPTGLTLEVGVASIDYQNIRSVDEICVHFLFRSYKPIK